MGFRTVVITKHAKINYKMGQMVVRTDMEVFQIPISDIQILMIATTRAVITSYCVQTLLASNIKIIFGDEKGFPIGEINGYSGHTARNRNINTQFCWPEIRKDRVWQKIVMRKIEHQANLLEKLNLNTTGFSDLARSVALGDQSNREAVAAKMYFPRLYGKGFVRKNPEEMINGHLNYGYQILLSAMSREIHSAGFLTELGIHHASLANEFNLASDLIEIFRPIVDHQVYMQKEENLELDQKLALVDLLNKSIRFNGHEAIVTSAMAELLRNIIDYLAQKTDDLPDWVIEQ